MGEPMFRREDVRQARRESFALILQAERLLGALESHQTQMERLLGRLHDHPELEEAGGD
jgi:hypothetical protein